MATHGVIFYSSEVAVVEGLADEVILGLDLGEAFDELLLNHILDSKQEQTRRKAGVEH